MKKAYILFITLAIASAGCNKFIDIDEKGKVIPKTVEDYYQLLCDYGTFINSTNNVFFLSDEIKAYPDEINRIFYGAEMFQNGYLWKDYIYPNNDDNDQDWNSFYAQIYMCNMVLGKIDAAEGNNEALRKQAKGEALAQRAFAYFMLVNIYAKHYNPDSYGTDPGVPLYLEADINAQKSRATVKEVYELIEKDLLEAETLLPPAADFNYHPGKASTEGLLAKIYLYQQKWEQARTYTNKVLEVQPFLYDYNDYDFMPGMPQFMGLANFPKLPSENRECVWYKQANIPFIYMIGVYMADQHEALYDEGDRRHYFAKIDQGPFGANTHGGILFPIDNYYRAGVYTPELYLIRAECNARLSEPEKAVNDLNTLRQKRIDSDKYIPYPTDKTDLEALELVLKERRIELFQECWRWFDLKRLNLDPRFRTAVSRQFGDQTVTLQPEANNWVVAIPKKVIILNPLIKQNPRDDR